MSVGVSGHSQVSVCERGVWGGGGEVGGGGAGGGGGGGGRGGGGGGRGGGGVGGGGGAGGCTKACQFLPPLLHNSPDWSQSQEVTVVQSKD